MARIKIKDLPKDMKISKEEMKVIRGGFQPQPEPPGYPFFYEGWDQRYIKAMDPGDDKFPKGWDPGEMGPAKI